MGTELEYEKNGMSMKDSIKNLLMLVILQFPISSMLKVYIGPLNVVLTGIVFLLFFYVYLRYKVRKRDLYLMIYILLSIIYNLFLCGLEFYENNMLFYFPFLILYFCFFTKNTTYIYNFLTSHKLYIDCILVIWNLIVIVSLFIPSCYVDEGENRGFVSFAGSTFLLCPIAIYVFALLVFQYIIYKKKIYMASLIIPSLCVLLGTTRTYLIVLMCAWLIFIYVVLKNKRWFVPLMGTAICIFVLIVLISPVASKFVAASARVEDLGMDPLEAFTSGRSVFWTHDLDAIFSQKPMKILAGSGVNFLFEINLKRYGNSLWAHNDFIQILSDYGIVGVIIYFYMFKHIMGGFLKKERVSKTIIFILILMWVFNAFFNMFYTYFCAVLSFPFYLLVIKIDIKQRNTMFELRGGTDNGKQV